MKKDIHPDYFQAKVVCAGCRTTFTIGSTLPEVSITVCSECHPFYTGKKMLLDTAGRVEKFNKRYAKK
jgi:large subunit ribosomal protein L31